MKTRTPVRIAWSKHARERRRQRGVSRAQCQAAIRKAVRAGKLTPGSELRLVAGNVEMAVACSRRGRVSVITVMARGRRREALDPNFLRARVANLKLRARKNKHHDEEE